MLSFRLRSLFALTLLICIGLGLGRLDGYRIGFLSATLIPFVVWVIASRGRGYPLIIRLITLVLCSAVLWLIAVDWSWFVDTCQSCHCHRDRYEYRIYGLCVDRSLPADQMYVTELMLTLDDFGMTCQHDFGIWYKQRWWGLVWPQENGGTWISGGIRHSPEISQRIRNWANEDPQRANAFRKRVVDENDFNYFWVFFNAISTDEQVDVSDP